MWAHMPKKPHRKLLGFSVSKPRHHVINSQSSDIRCERLEP